MRTILILLMLVLCFGNSYADTRDLKTENDGFKWYRVTDEKMNRGAEDTSGKVLVPLSDGYNWVTYDNGFLCGVNTSTFEYDETTGNIVKQHIGYYTKDGKCIIKGGQYDNVYIDVDNDGKRPSYFSVSRNGRWGACDMTGRLVLDIISERMPLYHENGFEIYKAGERESTGIKLSGHNNLNMADHREKSETDGFKWTELRNSDWEYGALASDGQLLFDIKYDGIEYMPSKIYGKTGIFIIEKDDAKGWYAADGTAYIPVECGYTYIRLVGEGNYVKVDKGGLENGIFETSLGEIIPPGKYDSVRWDKDGFFAIEKNDKNGAVDLLGNVIVQPIYDSYLSRDENGIYYLDDNADEVYVYESIFPETKDRIKKRFETATANSNPADAIQEFRNVILADPMGNYGYLPWAYKNIAYNYYLLGRYDDAATNYAKTVELNPSDDEAKENLDICMNLANDRQGAAQPKASKFEIGMAILNAIGSTLSPYTYSQESYDAGVQDNKASTTTKARRTKNNAFSNANNERRDRDTYNNYAGQLIDMNSFPERYNDAQRRRIQSSMKALREKWGFTKSSWEDWSGK